MPAGRKHKTSGWERRDFYYSKISNINVLSMWAAYAQPLTHQAQRAQLEGVKVDMLPCELALQLINPELEGTVFFLTSLLCPLMEIWPKLLSLFIDYTALNTGLG